MNTNSSTGIKEKIESSIIHDFFKKAINAKNIHEFINIKILYQKYNIYQLINYYNKQL
jgi:hypothetical protein